MALETPAAVASSGLIDSLRHFEPGRPLESEAIQDTLAQMNVIAQLTTDIISGACSSQRVWPLECQGGG